MCEKASKDMNTFYSQPFINYSKTVKGGNVFYTEVIAKWLLEHSDCFGGISEIKRRNPYIMDHTGEIKKETFRVEEITAKRIFNTGKDYGEIGKIVDYQVPLKDTRDNKGVGKIDLLSVNEEQECAYILEFKKKDSPETMLRCVLEGYTYLRQVCKEKLLNEYDIKGFALKAAPLVYIDSVQHQEYMDKNREYLHKLMEKLDCKPFFIKERITYDIK